MMLPGVVTMIPQFILFARLPAFGMQGSPVWVNTFLPLIVPAFGRQRLLHLPAAPIYARHPHGAVGSSPDGRRQRAAHLVGYRLSAGEGGPGNGRHLHLPGRLARLHGTPAVSSKRAPLHRPAWPAPVFEHAAGGAPAWNWLMAASLVVMLPVLLVFIVFQQHFIEGITLSGMGGEIDSEQ